MNIARQICFIQRNAFGRNTFRKFGFSSINHDSVTSQPQVTEEKFGFEDIQAVERTERRKEKIPPFMKDIFISVFNRDLLAYPEILNKEESNDLDRRVGVLEKVFTDRSKTSNERKEVLKRTRMYSAPVSLTQNGLAMNCTESLRYLEVIGDDVKLGQELSDHWVGLKVLKLGLTEEQYNGVIDDLITGDHTVSLCIKEKVAEKISQPDFRTSAEMDGQGIWKINGQKICSSSNGYLLVLAAVEASRIKAFLIHPGARGVEYNGDLVTFRNVQGTPLEMAADSRLAQVLSLSRLYAASLCRNRLKNAMSAVMNYVKPRAFSGKPLSEVPSIRAVIGDAMLDMYASESAEYFTAGLIDGYEEPDTEIEVAMCRNFMAHHGLTNMLKLLAIPDFDEDSCRQMFDDMRHTAARGESLDSINIFIGLNGIHHAAKSMAEEVKQIRNPLFHPTFIIKKAFSNRHQEKDNPKLNLYLAEHLHPSLKLPSEQLEYCTLRMRYASETILSRHGAEVGNALTELSRLAEAGTEILAMTAVLARASRSYCIGLRNSEVEMKLAACFVEKTKERVKKIILEVDDGQYLNLDHFRLEFGRKILDTNTFLVEKPTSRVFW